MTTNQTTTSAAGATQPAGIRFDASKLEMKYIIQIAKRAVALAAAADVEYAMQDAMMDIEAAHCNGCALELERLARADDATFGHDVFGIRRHINRKTGEIEGCFMPRLAMPQFATA